MHLDGDCLWIACVSWTLNNVALNFARPLTRGIFFFILNTTVLHNPGLNLGIQNHGYGEWLYVIFGFSTA